VDGGCHAPSVYNAIWLQKGEINSLQKDYTRNQYRRDLEGGGDNSRGDMPLYMREVAGEAKVVVV
jgi:hypothetical protein